MNQGFIGKFTQHRMLPTQQCLSTDPALGFHADFRLEVEQQIVVAHRLQ
ncbi:Uncharacterised protein [Vibrio cholerae]|nr:Uncharacterised protein [Vibrio cholerae]